MGRRDMRRGGTNRFPKKKSGNKKLKFQKPTKQKFPKFSPFFFCLFYIKFRRRFALFLSFTD